MAAIRAIPTEMARTSVVLLGKILRIDIDQTEGDLPYAIPDDNPFIDRDDARSEVWAYGLRNPWRFSFDRETGELYIGDVGQGEIEEANFQPAGEGGLNYGWNTMEGTACYLERRLRSVGHHPALLRVLPLVWRRLLDLRRLRLSRRSSPRACPVGTSQAITAPGTSGRSIRETGAATDGLESGLLIPSFAEDADGELYVVDLNGGIYKIVP